MLKTIKENVSNEIVEKKSKFIADIMYVQSVEEAEKCINDIKKKYYDAKHHCFAYSIMTKEGVVNRFSDDGEPSGTAGAPILNIINKNDLINVVVVVTRYFGGILLGTGGLVRAYSDATLEAIDSAEKVEKCMGQEAEVEIEYNNLENFKHYCKINNIFIGDFVYSDIISCRIQLPESKKQRLIEDFETKKVNLLNLKFLSKKLIDKCIIK